MAVREDLLDEAVKNFNGFFNDILRDKLYESVEEDVENIVKSIRASVKKACMEVAKEVSANVEKTKDHALSTQRVALDITFNGEKVDITTK